MKQCILLSGILFLFCSISSAQENTAKNPDGRPALTFINNDTLYDFGGVPKGERVEIHIEIKNTGNAPLVITAIKCESGNVACTWAPKSIKPRKTGVITVTYTSSGDIGTFSNDIFITSNATETPYPFLHIKGAVIPEGNEYIAPARPVRNRGSARIMHVNEQ